MNNIDPLLSLDESAQYLGISQSSLRALVRGQWIDYARIGKLLKFRRSTLDSYIATRTLHARPAA